jgi:hypothetical protein
MRITTQFIIFKELFMSYLFSFSSLSSAPRAPSLRAAKKTFQSSHALAGLLSAAVLAALLVVADQLIDSWAEGHLLLAWVLLWSALFAGLAVLVRPLRIASVATARWMQSWLAARAQARHEQAVWEFMLQDPRMLQELRAAHARSTDI